MRTAAPSLSTVASARVLASAIRAVHVDSSMHPPETGAPALIRKNQAGRRTMRE